MINQLLKFAVLFILIGGCGDDKTSEPTDKSTDTSTTDTQGTDENTDTLQDTRDTTTGSTDSTDPVDTNVAGITDEVEWILIPGGTFTMGKEDVASRPQRQVTVPQFYMARSETTVAQYLKCVEAGECKELEDSTTEYLGNHEKPNNSNLPVNNLLWADAAEFCTWAGGRLPSEAEWEYAARSGGKDNQYPWGNETPSCDYCVMSLLPNFASQYSREEREEAWGCGTGDMLPVCSKPAGNTEHGLCDMSGNVWEILQDDFLDRYEGAPTDGSAAVDADTTNSNKVLRGGNLASYYIPNNFLDVTYRNSGSIITLNPGWGFRCAKNAD